MGEALITRRGGGGLNGNVTTVTGTEKSVTLDESTGETRLVTEYTDLDLSKTYVLPWATISRGSVANPYVALIAAGNTFGRTDPIAKASGNTIWVLSDDYTVGSLYLIS